MQYFATKVPKKMRRSAANFAGSRRILCASAGKNRPDNKRQYQTAQTECGAQQSGTRPLPSSQDFHWRLRPTATRMQTFMPESSRIFHARILSFGRALSILLILISALCWGQDASPRRKIIIDQDAAGPAGTDQQSMLLLIQSPQTDVLGITVVTGDAWLKAELAHTLRMLEIIGRTDIPVVAGAEYPLVRRKDETELWEQQYGSFAWLGARTPRLYHAPDQLGEMPEGKPTTQPLNEAAAHFLMRMVRKYPHEITIYEGGPMTNLALAIAIDPQFPALVKELIFMGASLNPKTDDPEFVNTPRREFNLWFDPEAAHIVLMAPWKKIVCTTVDISVKTRLTQSLIDLIKTANSPVAKYV